MKIKINGESLLKNVVTIEDKGSSDITDGSFGFSEVDNVVNSVVIEDSEEDVKERSKVEELKKEERKEERKEPFITWSSFVTYSISHVSSINNEKLELMLSSLAETYEEPYEMLEDTYVWMDGIRLPRANVYSFETVFGDKLMDSYVTTLEKSKEYLKQQLRFAWFRAPIKEINNDPVMNFDKETCVGYEVTMKYPGILSFVSDRRKLTNGILREILEFTSTLGKDERILMQCSLRPADPKWWVDGEYSLKHLKPRLKARLVSGGDVRGRPGTGKGKKTREVNSLKKLSYPAFNTSLRFVIYSDSLKRSEMIGRGLMLVLRMMEDENEWDFRRIRDKRFKKWFDRNVVNRKVNIKTMFDNRDLLTPVELRSLLSLPSLALQNEFGLESDSRDILKIPAGLRRKNSVPIGESVVGNNRYKIGIPDHNLDDFMKSYGFIGSPRTGKDTAMINFIVEAAKRGHGAVVPDVINEFGNDRGMADSIRDALPPEKIIDLSLDDFNYPIYFGLDDIIDELGETGVNIVADNLLQILKLDDKFESKKLARLVAKACRCNLYDMYCFMRSPKYQLEVLERLKEEDELLALQLEHDFIDAKVSSNVSGAILSRLDELMGNDMLKYMFAQKPNRNIDFKKWIEEGKVVILRMTKVLIGELSVRVLMYLLTLKIFNLKKIMEKDMNLRDKTVFLVFNEFDQYMSPSLENTITSMITECPKYRMGMLFAFHSPSTNQISDNLWGYMKTSLNYFLFKNTDLRIYSDMKDLLHPMDIRTAVNTNKHESILIAYEDKKQHDPFFVSMLPPPYMRQEMYDNSYLTEEHKELYGTKLEIVRERIRDIEISMFKSDEDED